MEKKKVQQYFLSSLKKSQTLQEHFHKLTFDEKYKNKQIFTFINSNGNEEKFSLTVSQIDFEAQKIAKYLKLVGTKVGDRVLLLLNPGKDFILGFFGCLYGEFFFLF